MVSVVPPASDVTLGAKLTPESCAPSMVGAPSALPHSEWSVTRWLPAGGGNEAHTSSKALTLIGVQSAGPMRIQVLLSGKEPAPKLPVSAIDHCLLSWAITAADARIGVRAGLYRKAHGGVRQLAATPRILRTTSALDSPDTVAATGDMHTTCETLIAVTRQLRPPMRTSRSDRAEEKPSPRIVIDVPPAIEPEAGIICLNCGSVVTYALGRSGDCPPGVVHGHRKEHTQCPHLEACFSTL